MQSEPETFTCLVDSLYLFFSSGVLSGYWMFNEPLKRMHMETRDETIHADKNNMRKSSSEK